MMSQLWRETIRAAVDEAKPYSFGDPQRITEWAELFVEAHQQAPGGLSIEVGTWRGGTALVFLRLLERLYPVETRPMLFTVDPYGDKPYNGGDTETRPALYGDPDYVIMKRLLAPFANHAHFHLTSERFFHAPVDYWQHGQRKDVDLVTFALVDGEHDADTIADDVIDLRPLMAPHGLIVVDNVDNDPNSRRSLLALSPRPVQFHRSALKRTDDAWQEYAVLRLAQIAEAACQ